MPFVKLDKGILTSTIWCLRPELEVFVTALLMAEPREFTEPTPTIKIGSLEDGEWTAPPGWYGFVPAAGPGIVRAAHVDQTLGMEALKRLAEPEPESRSEEYGGRRMVRVNGGFLVLNFMKYRDFDHSAADRMRRLRERKRTGGENYEFDAKGTPCECCRTPVGKLFKDHNHSTLQQRGMICRSCNRLVGRAENNQTLPQDKSPAIWAYLKRYDVTRNSDDVQRNVTHSREQRAESRKEEADKTNKPEAAKPRARNPLFDALCLHEGIPLDQVSPKAAARIATALRDIKTVSPEVTPEEIARRGINYCTHFSTSKSAMSLASHWGKCRDAAQVQASLPIKPIMR